MAKKRNLVTWLIVIGIVILAGTIIYFKSGSTNQVSAELAQCIGRNAVMYSQTGCHFCKEQKDMFGSNVQYLNITECDLNPSICNPLGITNTPTWIINGQQYVGVQSIDKLKQLTGC